MKQIDQGILIGVGICLIIQIGFSVLRPAFDSATKEPSKPTEVVTIRCGKAAMVIDECEIEGESDEASRIPSPEEYFARPAVERAPLEFDGTY